MTPRLRRILTECDTMLADITRRYHIARRRLTEAEPGYPAHTPGAGEPGRGKGYVAGSITERLGAVRHPELEAQHRLDRTPHAISSIAGLLIANQLRLPWPEETRSPRWNVQQLTWSRWLIRQAISHALDVHNGLLGQLHGAITELHRTVMAWSTTNKPATHPSQRDQLADDLTGELCRSCLRIGERSPRHRGDLCGWCYTFERAEGFLPPSQLLEKHQRGKVYDRDVEPFRRAHRDRNKRRKAGAR